MNSKDDRASPWKIPLWIFASANLLPPGVNSTLQHFMLLSMKFMTSCDILCNLQVTLLFVDFTKAFESINRGKMEQILLAYGLPKETVTAITILYRNTEVKVRSPDRDTEYFDILAGVLQGDTLTPYFFIICLDYKLRTSIDKIRENGFELTKKRSRMYLAKTITDADYADDIALLANAPNQAETTA